MKEKMIELRDDRMNFLTEGKIEKKSERREASIICEALYNTLIVLTKKTPSENCYYPLLCEFCAKLDEFFPFRQHYSIRFNPEVLIYFIDELFKGNLYYIAVLYKVCIISDSESNQIVCENLNEIIAFIISHLEVDSDDLKIFIAIVPFLFQLTSVITEQFIDFAIDPQIMRLMDKSTFVLYNYIADEDISVLCNILNRIVLDEPYHQSLFFEIIKQRELWNYQEYSKTLIPLFRFDIQLLNEFVILLQNEISIGNLKVIELLSYGITEDLIASINLDLEIIFEKVVEYYTPKIATHFIKLFHVMYFNNYNKTNFLIDQFISFYDFLLDPDYPDGYDIETRCCYLKCYLAFLIDKFGPLQNHLEGNASSDLEETIECVVSEFSSYFNIYSYEEDNNEEEEINPLQISSLEELLSYTIQNC